MKSDVNGVSTTAAGEERYEVFKSPVFKGKKMVQYDYRTAGGNLFSCVDFTLEACRQKRNRWLEK
jgi:hypothetical protein